MLHQPTIGANGFSARDTRSRPRWVQTGLDAGVLQPSKRSPVRQMKVTYQITSHGLAYKTGLTSKHCDTNTSSSIQKCPTVSNLLNEISSFNLRSILSRLMATRPNPANFRYELLSRAAPMSLDWSHSDSAFRRECEHPLENSNLSDVATHNVSVSCGMCSHPVLARLLSLSMYLLVMFSGAGIFLPLGALPTT
jgi:hypothetical protein